MSKKLSRIHSKHIKNQLGGYMGVIKNLKKDTHIRTWSAESDTMPKKCYESAKFCINIKCASILVCLMLYIYIGGLIFRALEIDITPEPIAKTLESRDLASILILTFLVSILAINFKHSLRLFAFNEYLFADSCPCDDLNGVNAIVGNPLIDDSNPPVHPE